MGGLLALLLPSGMARAQGGDVPTVSITANQGSFNIGDVLRLSLSITGSAASRAVDEYLFVRFPNEQLFFFDLASFHPARGDDSSTFLPAVRGLVIPPRTTLNSIVLEAPLPDADGLDGGVYTWGVVLTPAGALEGPSRRAQDIEVVSSSFTTITFTKRRPEPVAPPLPPLPGGLDASGSYVITGGVSGETTVSGGGSFLTGGVRPDVDLTVQSFFDPSISRLVLAQTGTQLSGRMFLLEEEPEFLVEVVALSIVGTLAESGGVTLTFNGAFSVQGNPANASNFSGTLSGTFLDGTLRLRGQWSFSATRRTFSVVIDGVRE
ncbi:MAG: hypothetical protein HYY96_10240 [Candidatus Tectomicrobia bacterium]|nr:hypothetical protein [Candidatus Tectomicrobia bacterium]